MKKLFTLFSLAIFCASGLFSQTYVSTEPMMKNALLEEFTGIHCVYCPDGHAIAQSILNNNIGRAFVIAIHQGSFAIPGAGEPDYRTPFGDAIAGQTGLTGYPSGTVNRHVFSGTNTILGRGSWVTACNTIMNQPSPVNIGMNSNYDSITRTLDITVELYYTANAPTPSNFINVALIQDSIYGPQTGGNSGNNYRHMHMLRHLITGQWGDEVTTTTQGTLVTRNYSYVVPANYTNVPAVVEHMKVVGFVTESHQEVLTATEVYAVAQMNSIPTNIILSNSTVDENLPVGTIVGTLTSIDADPNDYHTYSLVSGVGDTDNDSFKISNDKLKTDEMFNYETQSSYSIRVQTKDNNLGTFSKSFIISVNNLNDMVLTGIIYGNPYCLDDAIGSIEIEIDEFIPPLSFLWSSGQNTQNIYNVVSGSYSVTITDGEGMELNGQFDLEPLPIYEGTNLCYLSSDGLFNVIYIDKGMDNYNVEGYRVYREGSSVGVYENIGEISSDEGYFTDISVNNMTRSYSYKVSMIDKCGNESPLSANHRTIHLSINSGTNNDVNLYWSHYVGLNTPSYSIYRKYLNEDYVLLEELSSNNNTYTDFPTEPNSLYEYYISFELENTCNSVINRELNDFIEVKSNHASLGGSVDINEFHYENIKTYPNPAKDKLFINLGNIQSDVYKILLINSIGELVYSSEGRELSSRIIEIPTLKFNAGLYNLNLYTKQGVIQKKIVIVR
ncbi:MAG: Omp28-related outer membrane protein [Lentimicrobium sp.]|nr:Omp28-related outer membrane protein [Lentimicrobium sp.]